MLPALGEEEKEPLNEDDARPVRVGSLLDLVEPSSAQPSRLNIFSRPAPNEASRDVANDIPRDAPNDISRDVYRQRPDEEVKKAEPAQGVVIGGLLNQAEKQREQSPLVDSDKALSGRAPKHAVTRRKKLQAAQGNHMLIEEEKKESEMSVEANSQCA